MGSPGDRGVAWMLAVQRGDAAAFARIVEEYQGPVFRLLRRLLGPDLALEDLAQEVFLRLYRTRDRYRPEGRLSTYLYRVTYNLALNHLRDERRQHLSRLPGSGAGGGAVEMADPRSPAPYQPADDATWARRVEQALQELPENQRTALVLQHYDGLDLEEIGAVLGVSAKAVKSLLHRGRENLRRILAPYQEAERDG